MDDFIYFDSAELDTNVKATVHLNGRLGFNRNAEQKLDLPNIKSVRLAKKKDYEIDKELYLIPFGLVEKGAFSVLKAGDYYYANTRALFDSLGDDYEKTKIIYDISEYDEKDGVKVYKLKRREIERKKDSENIE